MSEAAAMAEPVEAGPVMSLLSAQVILQIADFGCYATLEAAAQKVLERGHQVSTRQRLNLAEAMRICKPEPAQVATALGVFKTNLAEVGHEIVAFRKAVKAGSLISDLRAAATAVLAAAATAE